MPAFTDWLSAFSAAVSAAAAYWAWSTSVDAHRLSKRLADKAADEAFEHELERLMLEAAVIDAESAKLYFLAAQSKTAAKGRAMLRGGAIALTNSRLVHFLERVDEHIDTALEAADRAKYYRKLAEGRCENDSQAARKSRVEAAAYTIQLRGQFDSLQVERVGWVEDVEAPTAAGQLSGSVE